MRTITFYSYKGGVGRTLTLARAARYLANEGYKVFVLDLDLEAPGLHFKLLTDAQRSDLGPGFVELAHAFVVDGYFPQSLDGYVVRVTRTEDKGELRLMPAGDALSAQYWKTLSEIHWQKMFEVEFGDGVPLFLELKDRIQKTFQPDILLIDARTGITEVGGVALTLLPDDVVCLFSNNRESLWGTREIIRAIPRVLKKSQKRVRIAAALTRFPVKEETEHKARQEALAYLNEPATGEDSPNLERLFVLHSARQLEVDEKSELDPAQTDAGVLYKDYLLLFEQGLRFEHVDELELLTLTQEAEKADNNVVAAAKWSEVLDRLRQQSNPNPAALLQARLGIARALFNEGKYAESLPYFEEIESMAEAPLQSRGEAFGSAIRGLLRLSNIKEASVKYRRLKDLKEQIQPDLEGSEQYQRLQAEVDALGLEIRKRRHLNTAEMIVVVPYKRSLSARSGMETVHFEVALRLVTPILGGAAETREVDETDILRVPSIRGHLRFWWRAIYAGRLSSEDLYARERRLWGGPADETGGRSTVEVRIVVSPDGVSEIDATDVMPYGRNETQGAYALWPARATTRGPKPQPLAPRRKPGTRFLLRIRCNAGDEREVRSALRAWILFGGYGGRTRRGTGSFTVDGKPADQRLWLPEDATREAIRSLFGHDILEPLPDRPLDDVALLAGAGLRVGPSSADPLAAWTTALHWLRDFRQAQPQSGSMERHDPNYARDRGDNRPGRSNWPEADKVRRLSGRTTKWAHEPRHNEIPVWPRAGFGLPIVAQFQRTDRKTKAKYSDPGEPRDFDLRWCDNNATAHDRLASPLIVKALPLANGEFVPCALWLFRGYPSGGQVMLDPKDSRSYESAEDFDVLVAKGDTARYTPLDRAKDAPAGSRLRTAFFDWLASQGKSIRQVSR